MSSVTQAKAQERKFLSPDLIPIGIGLLALYIPTFEHFSKTLWKTDEEGHGPLILFAALWMLHEATKNIKITANLKNHTSGFISLFVGLALYIVGRSQGIAIMEVASMIPTIAGGLALTYGWQTVKQIRFPLFFLIFMAPVPGFIIDALTGPLKLFISTQAESLLYSAGYPIARAGVALTIGQYQLLVADACSGLNSMVSLIAVGLFYIFLAKRENITHNLILITIIPAIAVIANLIRVIVLCLVTYYYGDEVGQGLVHEMTGVMLFAISLTLMFIMDACLTFIFSRIKTSS